MGRLGESNREGTDRGKLKERAETVRQRENSLQKIDR